LGKTYGIKARSYWEHPWGTHWELKEQIENLMGTNWELVGNMLGTKEKTRSWGMSQIPPPPPLSSTKHHGQAAGNATHN